MEFRKKMSRIKEKKEMLMYHVQVGDCLQDYENMETFHIRAKIKRQFTSREGMLKKFHDNLNDLETDREKLKGK